MWCCAQEDTDGCETLFFHHNSTMPTTLATNHSKTKHTHTRFPPYPHPQHPHIPRPWCMAHTSSPLPPTP